MRWTSQKLARRLRLVEEMYHHRPDAQRLYRNSFIALEDYDETAYTAELEKLSATIEINGPWLSIRPWLPPWRG
jgi:hypothetical protein